MQGKGAWLRISLHNGFRTCFFLSQVEITRRKIQWLDFPWCVFYALGSRQTWLRSFLSYSSNSAVWRSKPWDFCLQNAWTWSAASCTLAKTGCRDCSCETKQVWHNSYCCWIDFCFFWICSFVFLDGCLGLLDVLHSLASALALWLVRGSKKKISITDGQYTNPE